MLLGIISDVHANISSLEACLEKLHAKHNVDKIYFLGDATGYLLNVNEVLDKLQKESISCILGNHDAMLLGLLPLSDERDEVYQIKRARKLITTENRFFLSSLLPFAIENFDKTRVLMVHGSPYNPLLEYVYPDTSVVGYEKLGYNYIFMGHTHRPFIKEEKKCTIVNVGSCGLPRDIGNMGSYALFDTERREVSIQRFEIDIFSVLKRNPYLHSKVIECFKRKDT